MAGKSHITANEGRRLRCHDGGPNRAIAEFLAERPGRYEIDQNYCDFFGYNVTWNTNGYLRRVGARPSVATGMAN